MSGDIPKILFTTSIFCDPKWRRDIPPALAKFGNHDFKMYTNRQDLSNLRGWDIVHVNDEQLFDKSGIDESVPHRYIYSQRYFKFMLWKYLASNNENYDMIVYCDGHMFPKATTNWVKMYDDVASSACGIVQQPHKNNPYAECDLIVRCRKDKKDNMENMKTYLTDHECPLDCPMMENTAFAYDPKNGALTASFEKFWTMYAGQKITYRDQPFLGYTQYICNISPIRDGRFFAANFVKGNYGNHTYC